MSAIYTVEAGGSETSSGDEELAAANISNRLDSIQSTMELFLHQLVQMNANITQNSADILQMNANITQNSADILQMNANITQNSADILQMKAYITQNSADILQMNEEIIRHSANIGQIKQNTALILKGMGHTLKHVVRNDVNARARIINSHAKSPTDRLRPLLNTANVSSQKFPATLAELDELDDEKILDLLQQLGLANDGDDDTKEDRLRDHIGVLAF